VTAPRGHLGQAVSLAVARSTVPGAVSSGRGHHTCPGDGEPGQVL